MDRRSGLCAGCRRTLTEIAEWVTYSDDEKRAIIADLPNRDPSAAPAEKTEE
jgi:predicted Fe-S protein YdhL (DUF1289 family)